MTMSTTALARAAALVLAGVLTLAAVRPAGAQVPSLDAVDSLIAAGRYDDARTTLEGWWSAREAFQVPGSDRVRGMMLRARLRTDPAEAETDYLGIIIGHPTSPQAPEALLRLGQSLLASGQAARAAGYLQRLAADYPGRPQRAMGMLWLARAQNAARHPAEACRAARDGLADAGGEPDLASMLRIEEAAACALAAAPVAGVRVAAAPEPRQPEQRPAEQRPAEPRPATPRPAAGAAAAATAGRYAVQSGAFRYREGADALSARLRDAGYEPRTVLVPRNTLLRIRVGRFATADEAAALVATLRRAGFDAVVVSDADEERAP